jgi:ABC-type multidrug transport system ATPase subunit
MFTVENVTKKYGKLIANDKLSFSVNDHQIAILLGPNGAGKSTIIKCIVGLLRFQGQININGFPNKSIEAKRLIGYVPEMPAIYDLLTVGEHLEFIARAYNLVDYQAYLNELITRFQLDDKILKLGKELSKGMQQKLSICCALLTKPKVLILDEPLVGLDPHAIKVLKAILLEQKEQGTSILISTHMINSVEDYWDVAHIMVNGQFKATKYNGNKNEEISLEKLFFEITEEQKK